MRHNIVAVKKSMTFNALPVVLGETAGANSGVRSITKRRQLGFRLLVKFLTGGTHDVLCRYTIVTHQRLIAHYLKLTEGVQFLLAAGTLFFYGSVKNHIPLTCWAITRHCMFSFWS